MDPFENPSNPSTLDHEYFLSIGEPNVDNYADDDGVNLNIPVMQGHSLDGLMNGPFLRDGTGSRVYLGSSLDGDFDNDAPEQPDVPIPTLGGWYDLALNPTLRR